VEGISYTKTGLWYKAEQVFQDEFLAYVDRLISKVNDKPLEHSLYEAVEYDSGTEAEFVKTLENDPEVLLYVKLPRFFTIPTPLSTYNPDWAIVIGELSPHGELTGKRVYLVHETKETSVIDNLAPDERAKVLCGQAHFSSIGVPYYVGSSWLPGEKTGT
jgi:type III restriction enzyme